MRGEPSCHVLSWTRGTKARCHVCLAPGCPRARPTPCSQDVDEKLRVASDTRQRIQIACEEYRPAARRAMQLYFLVTDFSAVNCMYQVRAQGLWAPTVGEAGDLGFGGLLGEHVRVRV